MRREAYLAALDIPVWVRRERAPSAGSDDGVETDASKAGAAARITAMGLTPVDTAATVATADWTALRAAVSGCTLCDLHRTRTQTVFGVGRQDADLLVVGEAPGADEDRQGEPFVGRAGKLLNAMLRAIGFDRGDVYIANILKCRPPNNRDPKPEESTLCTRYLDQQIRLIEPKAMLALGRIAAQWLLQSDQTIGRLRGQVLRYGESEVPIVATYHPAYLLRSPLAKAKSWQDLCMVRDLISGKQ